MLHPSSCSQYVQLIARRIVSPDRGILLPNAGLSLRHRWYAHRKRMTPQHREPSKYAMPCHGAHWYSFPSCHPPSLLRYARLTQPHSSPPSCSPCFSCRLKWSILGQALWGFGRAHVYMHSVLVRIVKACSPYRLHCSALLPHCLSGCRALTIE